MAGGVAIERSITGGRVASPVVLLKSAVTPVAMLKPPSVLLERANAPVAVFSSAMVLFKRAAAPTAVLLMPVVLNKSAHPSRRIGITRVDTSVPAPTPVLKLPVVALKSEYQPTPVFAEPVVRLREGVLPFRCVEPGRASVWSAEGQLPAERHQSQAGQAQHETKQ